MEDVGGKSQLFVNGVQYKLKANPTITPGGESRSVIIGVDGVMHGTKVDATQPGVISGVITDAIDLDIRELKQLKNATVKVIKANGKNAILTNACFSGTAELSGDEGEIAFEFQGSPVKEI